MLRISIISLCMVFPVLAENIASLEKKASAGDDKAQYVLGKQYEYMRGATEDLDKAIKWYTLSSQQGNADAQYALAKIYTHGRSVRTNPGGGIKFNFRGKKVSVDHEKAFALYQKAADQGHMEASHALGDAYKFGKGTGKDYVKALQWYQTAAEKGHASAQNALGVMYSLGQGTQKNKTEGCGWYQKSAEQKYRIGIENLAECYAFGKGVDPDLVKAYALFDVVAHYVTDQRAKDRNSKKRDDMRYKIERKDPKLLDKAQALSIDYRGKYGPLL